MSTVYLKYFGLNESPFAITPDPAFVYLSPAHRDALAHLLHGVGQDGSGGFVQLTGEVGTGKTTMCRCLLEQLPEKTQVALILNPLMTPREMLATICEELGIETREIADSSKRLVDALNAYLLGRHADGWRTVVVIDEAQNLSPESLEQVRLLTNLETAKHKLLQMVLLGQPELRELLQRRDLRQLAQRITARYHLAPLNATETAAYVRHRMEVAGAPRNPFSSGAMKTLHQRSGGVPRLINIIADRALAGAYAVDSPVIRSRLVHAAADEVQPGERQLQPNRLPWLVAAGSVAVLLLVTLAMYGWPQWRAGDPVSGSIAQIPAPVENVTQPLVTDRESERAEEEPNAEPPAVADNRNEDDSLGRTAIEPEAGIDDAWLARQHALAWHGLAALWGDPENAEAIRTACNGERRTGFACLEEQGNWSRIRQLGLPVLLVLQTDRPRHLLLRGIGDHEVLVGADEEARWLPRAEVEARWLGRFFVSWPQAPDWPVEIHRGQSGEAVDIVLEMAAQADPPWTGGMQFNESFKTWLETFQRRNGLEADGIVGPVTLLHLMAPTISSPRLAAPGARTAKES